MFHRISFNFVFICFILARAKAYNVKGNEAYRRKDFSDAIRLYTEGIEVNCKDDELKAKLYSNRGKVHFRLGEMFEFFSMIFLAWQRTEDFSEGCISLNGASQPVVDAHCQKVGVLQHGCTDDFKRTFAPPACCKFLFKNQHMLTGQKMRRNSSAHPRGKPTRSVPAQRGSTENCRGGFRVQL